MDDKKDSSAVKPKRRIIDITLDEILHFLEAHVKNPQCPVCWSNEWTLINDPDLVLGIVSMHKDGTFPMPPRTVPVAAVGCDVCGYVRHHALGVIHTWLQKNPG